MVPSIGTLLRATKRLWVGTWSGGGPRWSVRSLPTQAGLWFTALPKKCPVAMESNAGPHPIRVLLENSSM